MMIKERISQTKQKIEKLKGQRNILTKVQIFKFQPFSRKQKQILTWWVPDSPVKDFDGIIADGAIRSGKTVCMSLSFVMWAMSTFSGQNFAMCGKTIVSAKYCYAAHESRLHQNDRCKRFALCLVLTVRFRSLAPWGKLFQLFI